MTYRDALEDRPFSSIWVNPETGTITIARGPEPLVFIEWDGTFAEAVQAEYAIGHDVVTNYEESPLLSREQLAATWRETEKYYQDRLIEAELLDSAVYIESGDIAVPVGVFRRGGFVSVTDEDEARSVVAQLWGEPGFPDPRRGYQAVEDTPFSGHAVEHIAGPLWRMNGEVLRDYGGLGHVVLWGDDQPDEYDDTVRGHFFGFTPFAIKQWHNRAIPGWQANSGDDEAVFNTVPKLEFAA